MPEDAIPQVQAIVGRLPKRAVRSFGARSDPGRGRNESFQAQVQTRGDHPDGAGVFLDIEPGESPSAIADHRLDLDGVAGNVTLLFEQERATPPEECPWTVPRHKRHLVVDAGQTLVPLDARYEQRGTGGGAYLWGCESMETWPQFVELAVGDITGPVRLVEDGGNVSLPEREAGLLRLTTQECESFAFESCRSLWTLRDILGGGSVRFNLQGGTSDVAYGDPYQWDWPLSLCLSSLRAWLDLRIWASPLSAGDGELICI